MTVYDFPIHRRKKVYAWLVQGCGSARERLHNHLAGKHGLKRDMNVNYAKATCYITTKEIEHEVIARGYYTLRMVPFKAEGNTESIYP